MEGQRRGFGGSSTDLEPQEPAWAFDSFFGSLPIPAVRLLRILLHFCRGSIGKRHTHERTFAAAQTSSSRETLTDFRTLEWWQRGYIAIEAQEKDRYEVKAGKLVPRTKQVAENRESEEQINQSKGGRRGQQGSERKD